MKLKKGSVVFAPSRDTYIITDFGKVTASARSVVLMMAFHHGLAIFNIDDQKVRAVTVSVLGRELGIAPGSHLLLTADSIEHFEDVNPAQLFGYRNLKVRQLGQGMKAFESEFSVQQAMVTVEPLKQLVTSNNLSAKKMGEVSCGLSVFEVTATTDLALASRFPVIA